MMEAAAAGIKLVICITEGVPTLDVVTAHSFIKKQGAQPLGPNCPGLISPDKSLWDYACKYSNQVELRISRSGTLTYEIVYNLLLREWDNRQLLLLGRPSGGAILQRTSIDV